jgi:peptidoglycan/LPS O-acetylase OafA/YrhL
LSNAARYRPEIDGLRAIAVLPVILFHAGLSVFSGGFLGVDVFFVISGYLITLILCTELETGHFSILNFYDRRARRILPALFLVILFTIPFAWALMPPDALEIYFRSLPATTWFSSNVHFYFSQGYFTPDAELQPLLHTWSLAVEEQFYLVFPILLAFMWKLRLRIEVWLSFIALISLLLCLWQVSVNQDAAFYLPHTRIWELLAGATLAVLQSRANLTALVPQHFRTLATITSSAVLLICFVCVDDTWLTPGVPNALVVLATTALLAFATGADPIAKVLALKPLVLIGLISYSAYLWHHPLFAFARLSSLNQPSMILMLGLSVLSLVLAYCSWRWVEKPFRQKGYFQRKAVFGAAMFMMLAFGVGGFLANSANFAMSGYTQAQADLVRPSFSKAENCVWKKPADEQSQIELCEFGKMSAAGPVILWGDSHAAALLDELDLALKAKNLGGYYMRSSPCLRIPGIVPTGKRDADDVAECNNLQNEMFDFLKQAKPSAFVVSMRWTLRLYPVTGAQDKVGFDNGEGGVETESARANWAKDTNGSWSLEDAPKSAAIDAFLGRLNQIAPVIVVGPVPEVGWHVGNQNFKSLFVTKTPPQDISTDYGLFSARNAVALEALETAEKQLSIMKVEPSQVFCNSFIAGRCVAQFNGITYYADDDHLSAAGAALVIQQVIARLPQASQSKP